METFNTFETLKSLAHTLEAEAIEIRRHLHMYPELSWKEDATLLYLKEKIEDLKKNALYLILVEEKKGGLIVDLEIDSSFKRLLFRADIDALPITEETNLPFSSQHSGVMHACGHDMHASMLYGALKACAHHKLPLKYNLRFVFQRAEEVELSGGKSLVEAGACEGVDKVFGLHISSTTKLGLLMSNPGQMLANPCNFSFTIKALGGHVSSPHEGSNAIDIATDIHLFLRNYIQNHVAMKERVCLVPSISQAGVACNVMPGHAFLCYSLRNFLQGSEKKELLNKIQQHLHSVAKLYEATKIENFVINDGFPILENNKKVFNESFNLLKSFGLQVGQIPSMFAGEDFAYFLAEKPGCFWMLGAKQGHGYSHHTSQFNPDEKAIAQGILFWLLLAIQKA